MVFAGPPLRTLAEKCGRREDGHHQEDHLVILLADTVPPDRARNVVFVVFTGIPDAGKRQIPGGPLLRTEQFQRETPVSS